MVIKHVQTAIIGKGKVDSATASNLSTDSLAECLVVLLHVSSSSSGIIIKGAKLSDNPDLLHHPQP